MTKDAMGTIQRVLEKVNALPQDKRRSAMTMLFGKEFADDASGKQPRRNCSAKLTANDARFHAERIRHQGLTFCSVVAG